MRRSIDTYVQSIASDNAEYIIEGGYDSISEYIISNAESGTGWAEFFDDSELEEPFCEPSDEQIEELKNYLSKYYNYNPKD